MDCAAPLPRRAQVRRGAQRLRRRRLALHRPAGDERLQAAVAAAAAQDSRGSGHLDVRDLAGGRSGPAVHLSAGDDTHAQPEAETDVEEVLRGPDARGRGQCHDVDLVVDPGGDPHPLGEPAAQGEARPGDLLGVVGGAAGGVIGHRRDEGAVAEVHRDGDGDAQAPDVGELRAAVAEVSERREMLQGVPGQDVGRGEDALLPADALHDGAVEVHQGRHGVAVGDRQDEDSAGRRVEAPHLGSPPASGLAAPGGHEQAEAEGGLDAPVDGVAPHGERLAQVGAGDALGVAAGLREQVGQLRDMDEGQGPPLRPAGRPVSGGGIGGGHGNECIEHACWVRAFLWNGCSMFRSGTVAGSGSGGRGPPGASFTIARHHRVLQGAGARPSLRTGIGSFPRRDRSMSVVRQRAVASDQLLVQAHHLLGHRCRVELLGHIEGSSGQPLHPLGI